MTTVTTAQAEYLAKRIKRHKLEAFYSDEKTRKAYEAWLANMQKKEEERAKNNVQDVPSQDRR